MTSTEEVVAAIDPPTRPPALSIEERDAILYAATAHAAACRAHQKWTDAEIADAGIGSVDTTLERLRELLNQATTTHVDQQLLERTLERDRAIQERDAARKERDLANTYAREANQSREQVTAELEAFKVKVVQVATDYAEEHNMCSVVDDALRDLGLEPKAKRYSGTLTITVNFHADLTRRRDLPSEGWVLQSLDGTASIQEAIQRHLRFDSDHNGGAVDDVEFQITDVDEVNA